MITSVVLSSVKYCTSQIDYIIIYIFFKGNLVLLQCMQCNATSTQGRCNVHKVEHCNAIDFNVLVFFSIHIH
jgi:hypothetical protein